MADGDNLIQLNVDSSSNIRLHQESSWLSPSAPSVSNPDTDNLCHRRNTQHQSQQTSMSRSPNRATSPCARLSSSPKSSNFPKYVYDLPYNSRKSLCDLLDADGSWRQLGGEYFGLSEIQLTLISHALFRGASPTNDLLVKWEQTNPKITQLFHYFSNMRHLRAMIILKPFIDPETFSRLFEECQLHSPAYVDLNPSKKHFEDEYLNSNCKRDTQKTFQNQNLLNPSPSTCQGATGGQIGSTSLPPTFTSSDYYCHNYVNLSKDDDFKVVNNDLGKGCEDSKDRVQSWNDFNEKKPPRVDFCEDLEPSVQQTCIPSVKVSMSQGNQSSLSSTRTTTLSQEEEDLEILYKELMIATDDFSEDNVIGSGGFGVVYKGEWKGTQVAIKRLKSNNGHNRSQQSNNNHVSQAITELRILNRYRIDNILPLYGISLDGPEACIVYQYMPNGSLEDRLLCKQTTNGRRFSSGDNSQQTFPILTWHQRAAIGEGIAKALNYLHTLKGKPLVHGDVKSANVLLDAQFEPKLGDFGLSRQVNSDTNRGMYTHVTVTSVHGTSVYLPPEYLRQKILSPAVDTYSYGIVMLEMATGKRAYDGKKLLIELVEDEMKAGITDSSCEGAIRLRDGKLPDGSEGQSWFHSLIKLGLDCAHKMKRKRPDMAQVLDFYATCKTRDRIRRLSMESGVKESINGARLGSSPGSNDLRAGSIDLGPSLPLPPDNADIKTPLELQLWYDMVKNNAPKEQNSTVCPTMGSEPGNISSMQDENNSSIYSDFVEAASIPVPQVNETNSNDEGAMIPLITELGISNRL